MRLTRWWRVAAVTLAGLTTGLSFLLGAWPLAPLGVAGLTALVAGRSTASGFRLGWVWGVAMLLLAVGWVGAIAWPLPILLAAVLGLAFGAVGAGTALVSRLPRAPWPLLAACWWVAVEWVYSRFPFGGFGWTRLGWTSIDSPLAPFVTWGGVAGQSLLVAATGTILGWAALALTGSGRSRVGPRPRRARIALALGALVLVQVAGLALGAAAGPSRGAVEPGETTVNVAMVQGNVQGEGVSGLGRARAVTVNHVRETERLMARVQAGSAPDPSFVLWPENSSDTDPIHDPTTRALVDQVSREAAVPLLVGAVTDGPGPDERQTTALWWPPDGVGPTLRYAKRNLVPFGEYIPFRSVLLGRVPMLELVGAQSVPGTTPGRMQVPLATSAGRRDVTIGDLICFELAYDSTVREAVTGSELVVVQSNNATYRGTAQPRQQWAMTRMRALEADRPVVVATTDSLSGLIDRHGHAIQRTREGTAASSVYTVGLRTSHTAAIRWGGALDAMLSALGAMGVLTAAGFAVGGRLRRTDAASGTMGAAS